MKTTPATGYNTGKPVPANTDDMWGRGDYIPGDGETLGAVRPGSQDHSRIPSRMGNMRNYRDGRSEVIA